ncbi:hypothetical protein TNCV_1885981 [Trichonephila clavipes]|nr:hypothetical protein TNCV_1885981 [Trichonephila clavipes]
MMFTSRHGLIPKWFIWLSFIQGTGNLTLIIIEHPTLTWFQQSMFMLIKYQDEPKLTLHAEVYHLKNFPHVFYGGKALNGFPVRWTLGLSNPKRNDQTSSVSKERKRTAFSFPVAVNCDFIDSLFLKFSSFTKIIDILHSVLDTSAANCKS